MSYLNQEHSCASMQDGHCHSPWVHLKVFATFTIKPCTHYDANCVNLWCTPLMLPEMYNIRGVHTSALRPGGWEPAGCELGTS